MISRWESAAILAPPGELDARADLLRERIVGAAQAIGDQPLGETLRDDVLHLLAEEFIAAVAELLLRLDIQEHDFAGLVHDHHRIGGRLQQAAISALHLRHVLLRGLAHADVADGRRHQDAVGALERAKHDFDGKRAAILAPPGELDARADLLRERIVGAAGIVGDQPLRETFRDDVLHLLAEELVAAVTELLLRLDIQEHDVPGLVHDHHRIRGRFHESAVLGLGVFGFAQIARNLGKSPQLPGSVTHRRERRARKESRAILTHTQPVFFVPAVCCGNAQYFLGSAACNVFGQEKERVVFTDDLIGAVAFNPFGAGIPGQDPALRIQ